MVEQKFAWRPGGVALFAALMSLPVASALPARLPASSPRPVEWRMDWNGRSVPLAASMGKSSGDPRFYRTGDGVYFELTSPGGGENAAMLHRSVRIFASVPGAARSATLRIDLDGSFGAVTVGSEPAGVARRGAVIVPVRERAGRRGIEIELHDVEAKTWGWLTDPAPRASRP